MLLSKRFLSAPSAIMLSLCLFTTFCSCKFRQKVSMLVHHAKIYTANEQFTVASAMAINDGKIIAIGTDDDILKAYESDQQVDGSGKTIYPGFIDAHSHFTGYATDMWK